MQAKARIKRAQERIALGVKKLKLKPVAPKPKPIKYCRHYLKGRCHEVYTTALDYKYFFGFKSFVC